MQYAVSVPFRAKKFQARARVAVTLACAGSLSFLSKGVRLLFHGHGMPKPAQTNKTGRKFE